MSNLLINCQNYQPYFIWDIIKFLSTTMLMVIDEDEHDALFYNRNHFICEWNGI